VVVLCLLLNIIIGDKTDSFISTVAKNATAFLQKPAARIFLGLVLLVLIYGFLKSRLQPRADLFTVAEGEGALVLGAHGCVPAARLAPYLILFAALYAGFGSSRPICRRCSASRSDARAIASCWPRHRDAAIGRAGAGHLADRFNAARLVFASCASGAALMRSATCRLTALAVAGCRAVAGRDAGTVGRRSAIPCVAGCGFPAIAWTGVLRLTAGTRRRIRRVHSRFGSCPARRVGLVGLGAAIWLNAAC